MVSPNRQTSINDSLTTGFQTWLQNKNYSSSTIRNYLVDINKYLVYVADNSLKLFSPNSVESYLTTVAEDSNKDRYTSSLSKFFQYAIDQHLININPIKKAKTNNQKPSSLNLETILAQYQEHLTRKKFTPATIKNYINDIQQFINWAESQSNGVK